MYQKNYQTVGRQNLIRFLKEHPGDRFTTDELVKAIPNSAKSSIYRNLTKLCDIGFVSKFYDEGQACNVFQYAESGCNCRNHFHAKCVCCGKIEHLDNRKTTELIAALQKDGGFAVDCGQSVFYGVCSDCQKKGGGARRNG